MASLNFLSVLSLLYVITLVYSAPDVNQLPLRDFSPGNGGSSRACSKLAGQENQCVEKIAKMEYRPLITIIEQNYKVPVPEITYTDIIDPQERPYTVQMPKLSYTKVPVTQIKETPETKRLRKIKEVVEKVNVLSTDVIRIPKNIPEPRVTEETVTIPEIQKDKVTKVIKKYRKVAGKKMIIDQIKEERRVRRVRRPILEIRPKYVNVTRIEYINRVVEVPKIIIKKLRLPRPIIQQGETVYEEKSNVQVKTSDYEEETPAYNDLVVEVDEVRREPKTVRIPYAEKTRVVRPVIFEAPINMPVGEPVEIERHVRVQGGEVQVPCGVPTQGSRYLPAKCPPCTNSGGSGGGGGSGSGSGSGCPTCQPCEMQGYEYSRPSVQFS